MFSAAGPPQIGEKLVVMVEGDEYSSALLQKSVLVKDGNELVDYSHGLFCLTDLVLSSCP